MDCEKYRLHIFECLKRIRELVDNALQTNMVDDELIQDIIELANSAARAKESEIECHTRRILEAMR